MSGEPTTVRQKSFPAGPWMMASAVLLFAVDRAFKWVALSAAAEPPEGFASFSLFRNEGIAFGIPLSDAIYWPASLFLLLLMVAGYVRAVRENDRLVLALHVFILLGSVSNFWDRLWHGAVTDYFIFFETSAWNIADWMIIGAIAGMFAYDGRTAIRKRHASATERAA